MTIQKELAKASSFICGSTKTAHGKLPASSATTTTLRPSNGLAGAPGGLLSHQSHQASANLRCASCNPRRCNIYLISHNLITQYAHSFRHLRANLPQPLGPQTALVPHHVRHCLGRGIVTVAGGCRRRLPLGQQARNG